MKDLTARPSFDRHIKPVHREISGRPHYTFSAYAPSVLDERVTTTASIQNGGISSTSLKLEVAIDWKASEPESVTFLDEGLKVQKPTRREPTLEEANLDYQRSLDRKKPPTFVSPVSEASMSTLRAKVQKAVERGVHSVHTIAHYLTHVLNREVQMFRGYSFEYRSLNELFKVNTYQALEEA